MNRPEAVPAMRVSGSGLVFAPSGLRSYIPTTRRRPFQVLPGGEAEVSSESAQGRIGPRAQPGLCTTAAGARSRRWINPGSKVEVASGRDGVSGAAREGARQLPEYEAGCESGAQDLEYGNPGAQSGERKSGPWGRAYQVYDCQI